MPIPDLTRLRDYLAESLTLDNISAAADAYDQATRGLPTPAQYLDEPVRAVIPAAVGVPKFAANVAKRMETLKARLGNWDFLEPIAYMFERYPKQMEKIVGEGKGEIFLHNGMRPGLRGRYSPSGRYGNQVYLNEQALEPIRRPDEVVETLAHEITHGRRYAKNDRIFENYIPSHLDRDAYLAQLEEVLARRAGQTASEGFRKYRDARDPRPAAPLSWTSVENR